LRGLPPPFNLTGETGGGGMRLSAPKRYVFDTLRILREEGLTILLVSQEVERSLELSRRAYVLENGQIRLEGISSELLNNDKVREAYLGM